MHRSRHDSARLTDNLGEVYSQVYTLLTEDFQQLKRDLKNTLFIFLTFSENYPKTFFFFFFIFSKSK